MRRQYTPSKSGKIGQKFNRIITNSSTNSGFRLINFVYLSRNWIKSAMNYLTITTAWKRFSLLSLSTLLLTATGFSQFLGLESEVHATSEHGTTYRIYAEFGSATDECVATYSVGAAEDNPVTCLLYTSPSPRDRTRSRMPSSA